MLNVPRPWGHRLRHGARSGELWRRGIESLELRSQATKREHCRSWIDFGKERLVYQLFASNTLDFSDVLTHMQAFHAFTKLFSLSFFNHGFLCNFFDLRLCNSFSCNACPCLQLMNLGGANFPGTLSRKGQIVKNNATATQRPTRRLKQNRRVTWDSGTALQKLTTSRSVWSSEPVGLPLQQKGQKH